MSVRSPTAGTWSSSQWRPDNEFETNRAARPAPSAAPRSTRRGSCSPARELGIRDAQVMMRPPASICSTWSRALSCASPLTPPMTRSPSTKRRGAGCDGRRPTGQDGEHIWPRPAVARAGSDDHVGEADRPAPLEEGVRVPSSGPGGEHVLPLQVHHRRWPSRPEPSRAGE